MMTSDNDDAVYLVGVSSDTSYFLWPIPALRWSEALIIEWISQSFTFTTMADVGEEQHVEDPSREDLSLEAEDAAEEQHGEDFDLKDEAAAEAAALEVVFRAISPPAVSHSQKQFNSTHNGRNTQYANTHLTEAVHLSQFDGHTEFLEGDNLNLSKASAAIDAFFEEGKLSKAFGSNLVAEAMTSRKFICEIVVNL